MENKEKDPIKILRMYICEIDIIGTIVSAIVCVAGLFGGIVSQNLERI